MAARTQTFAWKELIARNVISPRSTAILRRLVPGYLYTLTYRRPGTEWTAYAEYDPETDTITAQLPVYDPPPYDWKYEVTNGAALLEQRFNPMASILNRQFLGLTEGSRLLPIISFTGVAR